jgi:hypothetical protein
MTTNNVTNNWSPLTTKGDLFTYSTLPARIAVGSNYYFPQADSTATVGISYQLPQPEPQVVSVSMADFYGSLNGDSVITVTSSGTGSGATVVNSNDNAHLGIGKLDMGTTTTGFAGFNNNNSIKAFICNGSSILVETAINLSALSNGTDRYTMYFGLSDNSSFSSATNGAYISYTDNVNSGNWTVNINNASSITTSNGSTAPTANAWYKLRLIIGTNTITGYVGAAGSDFSLINTVNATLPTANLIMSVFFIKSAGTTDTFSYVDYMRSKITYNSLR